MPADLVVDLVKQVKIAKSKHREKVTIVKSVNNGNEEKFPIQKCICEQIKPSTVSLGASPACCEQWLAFATQADMTRWPTKGESSVG